MGGNGHAFENPEGVRLHEHPIHESTGIALITVQDDKALFFGLAPQGLPLQGGRKPGSAAALETAFLYFGNNLFGSAFGDCLAKRLETSGFEETKKLLLVR